MGDEAKQEVKVDEPALKGARKASKPWYTSKTIQAAAGVVGGAAVDAVVNGFNWRQAVIAAAGALFAYLRTITTKPVSRGKDK